MAIPARLSIVTIGVRDFARMKAFYEGLGWTQVYDGDTDFAHFETSGARVCLYPLDELYADAKLDDPKPPAGIALALNVAEKHEVDEVWRAWVDAGATPLKEPEDAFWGGRSSYVADPEGTMWEIAWAPGFTVQ